MTNFEADRIVEAARFVSGRGWAPAGAGNYSLRLGDGNIAITVSGAFKARLALDEVMTVDLQGRALDRKKPSAETALHLAIYRLFPHVGAVLHTHSIPVVAILRKGVKRDGLRLEGYELLKAFPGIETHETAVDLPVFDNSQDMDDLAQRLTATLTARPAPAFLIRDHGLYGWGASMDEALRVIEAAETLIACELELTRTEPRP